MNQIQLRHKEPGSTLICKCAKSKCLKMYCECFTLGYFCDDQCNCCECHNLEETQDEVRQARADIKGRNDRAFSAKVTVQKTANSPAVAIPRSIKDNEEVLKVHITGCRCKKSFCQKKYCECYQMGAKCIPGKCQCCNCKNC